MDTERLVEFTVLAEELNFRKAAERLLLSQSSLSRHIDELERQLGFRLFRRDRHQVALTSQGRRFLAEIHDYPDLLRRAIAVARNETAFSAGRPVRLGYGRVRGVHLVQRALADLIQTDPDIRVDLVEDNSTQLIRALETGEIDVALVRPPTRSAVIEELPLIEETLVGLLPVGHPLSWADDVALEDLLAEPFVTLLPSRFDASRTAVRNELIRARHGEPPMVVCEVETRSAVFLKVGAGIGVSLAREIAVRASGVDSVVARPLTKALPGLPISVAWRSGPLPDAEASVRDALIAASREVRPGFQALSPATG
jgi:DNA-binding transcriptional LysR family regulator